MKNDVECTMSFFFRAFGCIEEAEKAFLHQLKEFLCNFHFLHLKKM